ncbi:hypothetical protein AR158_c228L [Paramecium bursaria Chlorella virus AR158]|uniref:hypothetical protein n=1 Tax=Paramecium bursaria Chlorella virus AR158 TaxID=380598 RepID=UPI00015AA87E|nr:hypothetical protein AR158_c228L [Paramecium bursaria Chlorella virus AR158]ABU43774.1 hypothetical protein AR158_c228L [Paramecium bursaria Chlorella virus AR158]
MSFVIYSQNIMYLNLIKFKFLYMYYGRSYSSGETTMVRCCLRCHHRTTYQKTRKKNQKTRKKNQKTRKRYQRYQR